MSSGIPNEDDKRMTTRKGCKAKTVTAEEAISTIKNGSRIFIGSGCGEPQHLIHTMANNHNLVDIMIFQMLAHTLADYLNDAIFSPAFLGQTFFCADQDAAGGV